MLEYTKEQIDEQDKHYKHPRNLVDLFEDSASKWGAKNAIGTKNPKTRDYEWTTYAEIAVRVNNLRGGLAKLGLKKGEMVGVILNNSVEWFIIENAVHGLGGIYVPMYEKELEKTWEYIVRDAGIKYLFVSNDALYENIKKFKGDIKTLKEVFVVFGNSEKSLRALEESGKNFPVKSYRPHWSEAAELIYTSGTTGDPKGVLLSHGNLTACSQAGYHIYPQLDENAVSLAILPWAHVYGLSAELHNFLQFGGAIGLVESVDTIAEDLVKVRPSFLIAVPRVFNKIYDGIQTKMMEEGGIKKKLFDAACSEALKCRDSKKSLKLKILDSLVFSKIRARFGGQLQGVLTASALMNPEIAMFFSDIGIPTFDCYGLTETAPAITMNSPLKGNKYGTVGQCVENMHVVIDRTREDDPDSDDGEIIAYGAHVMMGYFNKPGETEAIMTKDTWMGFRGIRTGDKGRFDKDGYLLITGRYKDEYKLANGKYIHPESIETDIKLLHHVANAMVYGEGREYNVCVIAPDFAALKTDHKTEKWAHGSPSEIIQNSELKDFLANIIKDHLKKTFGGYEIPKKFLLIEHDFTLENGMLTQTLKVKRNEVIKVYRWEIDRMYV